MPRTVGSDGARTEAMILDMAIEMIAAHGFEAVTLRDLAGRVGLTAGSLYRYIPSKHDLLMTIVSAHMQDLFAAWEKARPDSSDPTDRLVAFIEFHVRYHSKKPREVLIANMELRSLAPGDRPKVTEMRRRYEAILGEILEDGIAAGRFSVPDVSVAIYAILAMLTGLTSWYQEGGRLTKAQLVDCYVTLVTGGVVRSPS